MKRRVFLRLAPFPPYLSAIHWLRRLSPLYLAGNPASGFPATTARIRSIASSGGTSPGWLEEACSRIAARLPGHVFSVPGPGNRDGQPEPLHPAADPVRPCRDQRPAPAAGCCTTSRAARARDVELAEGRARAPTGRLDRRLAPRPREGATSPYRARASRRANSTSTSPLGSTTARSCRARAGSAARATGAARGEPLLQPAAACGHWRSDGGWQHVAKSAVGRGSTMNGRVITSTRARSDGIGWA